MGLLSYCLPHGHDFILFNNNTNKFYCHQLIGCVGLQRSDLNWNNQDFGLVKAFFGLFCFFCLSTECRDFGDNAERVDSKASCRSMTTLKVMNESSGEMEQINMRIYTSCSQERGIHFAGAMEHFSSFGEKSA